MLYLEQPAFLPWLGFCEAMFVCETLAVYDDAQFSTGNVQNRNRIKSATGVEWMTAPVEARRAAIRDIRLAPSYDSRKLHMQLKTALGRAPYYDEMESVVVPALHGQRWLNDLNLGLLESIKIALGSSARIVSTSTLGVSAGSDRLDRIASICASLNEDALWAGSGTRSYLDEREAAAHGIRVVWSRFEDRHPVYRQLWGRQGFVPRLSVVDAVANLGWAGTRAMLVAGASGSRPV